MKKILTVFLIIFLITVGYFYLKQPKTVQETTNAIISKKPQIVSTESFIVIGDTGSGTRPQYDVAAAIQIYCSKKDCKSTFIAGDVIYDRGITSITDNQLQSKFEKPYENLYMPFYIVFGNHDYLGCKDCYIEYSTKSTKWTMPAYYYIQNFNNITFFIIDTENFNQTQQNWLSKVLTESKSKWKIVIGHRPLATNEYAYINELWNGKKELKELICSQADFYIAGHAHILENVGVLPGCTVKQLITGGGGAYLRKTIDDPKSIFHHEDYGFLALDVEKNSLQYAFVSKYTKVLHTQEINKR